MKLPDGRNALYIVAAIGAAIGIYEIVKVSSYLKTKLTDGTLNPASPNNAIYDDLSNDPTLPFNGSFGVWVWEKLHPNSNLPKYVPKKRSGATGAW